MNSPRFPQHNYPAESRYVVSYTLFVLAVIIAAWFLCRAGSNEAIRVASAVKALECAK
jgi:hypothetical protein